MPVVLGIEESLQDICAANIEVVMLEFTDNDDENKGEKENVLVLPVCTCDHDDLPVDIEEPNLN